jgi:ABC-type transport system involved in multi-copper enzyme maturation permease subunit
VTSGQAGAQLFGLGYRRYDGPRREPAWAILTLAVFTSKRVLGLGRGARHKILPAITLAIAYIPALVSAGVAALSDGLLEEDLFTYGEYTFIIVSALALFAALVAPEALCPDRRSGLLGLYLAGPLDRNRYLAAKAAGVFATMLAITLGPLLFMLSAFVVAGYGPSAGDTAAIFTAVAMAVSSFATRRAAAAVAVILLVFVPPIVAGAAVESAGAPEELDLISFAFVPTELSYRIFGETGEGDGPPITEVSTGLIAAGLVAWVLAGALVCWLRYRRIEGFR